MLLSCFVTVNIRPADLFVKAVTQTAACVCRSVILREGHRCKWEQNELNITVVLDSFAGVELRATFYSQELPVVVQ